jgi:endonuclease-3
MASMNRTALVTKLHKVLKKYYKPVTPVERPVLEQLLYACLLENAPYQPAEEALARLSEMFFDWNEVRVSLVRELAEAMPGLPQPEEAATRLKRALQGVFESMYSFDLEHMRKQNLGQAISKLQKIAGSSTFVVAHVTQSALGGHSIPIDRAALEVFEIFGTLTNQERNSGEVAGLERAIPKSKGFEFGSLLHQFAAELAASPYNPQLHKVLLEVAPDCKDRLPKRGAKKKEPPQPVEPPKKLAKAPVAAAPKGNVATKPGTSAPAKSSAAAPAKPGTPVKPAAKAPAPGKGRDKPAEKPAKTVAKAPAPKSPSKTAPVVPPKKKEIAGRSGKPKPR